MSRIELPQSMLQDSPAQIGTDRSARVSTRAGAATDGEYALGQVVAHYAEVVRQGRRPLLALSLAAALISGAYAVYKLNFSPEYRAVAKVTVQPTDAELRFTQVYVRSSSYDSANVVTRSHIEYLNSREIAARTYALLKADTAGLTPVETQQGGLIGAAKSAKNGVSQALKWLNSGAPAVVEPENSDAENIAAIQDAIRLRMIESSFVMEIAVVWEDPQTAARIANALATVYQSRSREQATAATNELTRFLVSQKEQSEALLTELLEQRRQLRSSTGIVDLAAERQQLLERLFAERAALDADRSELDSTRAILETFLPDSPSLRFDGLSNETKERLNLARLRVVELTQAIGAREQVVRGLQARIDTAAGEESTFQNLDAEIARVRTQLDDIGERLLGVRINQAEGIEPLRVIDLARAPAYPEEPKVLAQTVMGGVGGLLLGLMLLLGRDFAGTRVRTLADLQRIEGLKSLGPVTLDPGQTADANRRAAARPERPQDTMRPFLGWYEFDTDEVVSVLDVSQEDRAAKLAEMVLDHYPYSDRVHSGLAGLAPRPGYMPRAAAILICMGRGEVSAQELADLVQRIRRRNPHTPLAATFVDSRPGRKLAWG